MDIGPMTCPANAPAGLKYNRGYHTRFWVRPDAITFSSLWAVNFSVTEDGINSTAFRVGGYLGGFVFNWHMPEHATKLLICHDSVSESWQTFGALLNESHGEWLLTNQHDAEAARLCDDAAYVAQKCLHDDAIKDVAGVYFVSNGRGAVKVGNSSRSIGGRFASLQTATPDALRVVAIIPSPKPLGLESQLHALLHAKRIRGEWFAMTDEEAVLLAESRGGTKVDEFLC